MFKEIEYKELLTSFDNDYIIIDVRSPKEFEEDHIPEAVNIPIFNNEERAEVGTTYKQVSIEEARKLGVEIVSHKLPMFYEKVADLKNDYKHLVFYCSRGGYRSSSVVSFLQSLGHKNIWKIKGGYKYYRRFVNEKLPEEIAKVKFIVLYGNTGSGKTKILKSLNKKGADTLDLEGYANHRGSTLGGVGLNEQHSQKRFESLLLYNLSKRKGQYIFIEGESRRIGKVVIPDFVFDKITNGIHLKIKTPIDLRTEIILEDYVDGHDDEIIKALNFLRRRLGNTTIDLYIDKVKEKDFKYVAKDLMLNYYDPMYEQNERNIIKIFDNTDINETSDNLIQWLNDELEKGIHK